MQKETNKNLFGEAQNFCLSVFKMARKGIYFFTEPDKLDEKCAYDRYNDKHSLSGCMIIFLVKNKKERKKLCKLLSSLIENSCVLDKDDFTTTAPNIIYNFENLSRRIPNISVKPVNHFCVCDNFKVKEHEHYYLKRVFLIDVNELTEDNLIGIDDIDEMVTTPIEEMNSSLSKYFEERREKIKLAVVNEILEGIKEQEEKYEFDVKRSGEKTDIEKINSKYHYYRRWMIEKGNKFIMSKTEFIYLFKIHNKLEELLR